ncbi:MAG: nucleotidyltransferase domain-containing protein [Armatimonadota bacterium]|nr:nucleotidyltransferase domain-containing protein [Armatimonadota bacterium]
MRRKGAAIRYDPGALWYNRLAGSPIFPPALGLCMVDESILSEAVRRLVDRFNPEQVILFGSQATGVADSHSDVDLLVICRVASNRRKLMVEMDRDLAGLPIARDIIVLTPQEYERECLIPGTVARPAWLEGRVLYGRPH